MKIVEKVINSKNFAPIRKFYVDLIHHREEEKFLLNNRLMEMQLRKLESNYPVENFRIKLTPDHSLIKNDSNHPLYNQFPKFLVSLLQPESIVLEVGANVGDNLARMVRSRRDLKYIAIEPIKEYYKLLMENIEAIRSQLPPPGFHYATK
jgi:tRNA G46 methylase TrmB